MIGGLFLMAGMACLCTVTLPGAIVAAVLLATGWALDARSARRGEPA